MSVPKFQTTEPKVNRSLLNPFFESYKLLPSSTSPTTRSFKLPTPSRIRPAKHDIPYRVLEARTKRNQLEACGEGVAYVDDDLRVVHAVYGENDEIVFKVLYEFKRGTDDQDVSEMAKAWTNEDVDIPSLHYAAPYLLVSNGAGTVILLRIDAATNETTVLGRVDISGNFVITSTRVVHRSSENGEDELAVVGYVIGQRDVEDVKEPTQQKRRIVFQLKLLHVSIPREYLQSSDTPLEILKVGKDTNTLRTMILGEAEGATVPFFTAVENGGDAVIVCAAAAYKHICSDSSESQVVPVMKPKTESIDKEGNGGKEEEVEDTAVYPLQNTVTDPVEDVDFQGDETYLLRFAINNPTAMAEMEMGIQLMPTHVGICGSQSYLCSSFTPPQRDIGTSELLHTFSLRSDIDLHTYTLFPTLNLSHVHTFPALGFVQASKRDKRFMYVTYDSRHAVIVGDRYAYIYHACPKGERIAGQWVIDLGTGGGVLGVQQVGETCLKVLKEEEIVVVRWT
ncbi:hypothetical protein BC832DRAFT_220999 [Gaertneriomyces semiglobifer]|nr:hypothetical protein BC832DRAFT_220999 [Gaertneriomyces semiglobifer]